MLGGARSGKSTYAEKRASEIGGEDVLYVATSEIRDEEMRERVEKHREQRPSTWRTIEAPTDVAKAIRKANPAEAKVILLDCLTLLATNQLLKAAGPENDVFDEPSSDPFDKQIEQDLVREVQDLIKLANEWDAEFLIVSNEIGLGIVPAYALGRAYRDILGRANQILAEYADEVLFMVAGIPMKVK